MSRRRARTRRRGRPALRRRPGRRVGPPGLADAERLDRSRGRPRGARGARAAARAAPAVGGARGRRRAAAREPRRDPLAADRARREQPRSLLHVAGRPRHGAGAAGLRAGAGHGGGRLPALPLARGAEPAPAAPAQQPHAGRRRARAARARLLPVVGGRRVPRRAARSAACGGREARPGLGGGGSARRAHGGLRRRALRIQSRRLRGADARPAADGRAVRARRATAPRPDARWPRSPRPAPGFCCVRCAGGACSCSAT